MKLTPILRGAGGVSRISQPIHPKNPTNPSPSFSNRGVCNPIKINEVSLHTHTFHPPKTENPALMEQNHQAGNLGVNAEFVYHHNAHLLFANIRHFSAKSKHISIYFSTIYTQYCGLGKAQGSTTPQPPP